MRCRSQMDVQHAHRDHWGRWTLLLFSKPEPSILRSSRRTDIFKLPRAFKAPHWRQSMYGWFLPHPAHPKPRAQQSPVYVRNEHRQHGFILHNPCIWKAFWQSLGSSKEIKGVEGVPRDMSACAGTSSITGACDVWDTPCSRNQQMPLPPSVINRLMCIHFNQHGVWPRLLHCLWSLWAFLGVFGDYSGLFMVDSLVVLGFVMGDLSWPKSGWTFFM